jgi:hypothetical protein
MNLELISIEITNRCDKACSFCYNHSAPGGETRWSARDADLLISDAANHGVRAVSFGGGEPLQHPELADMLDRTRGKLFRSVTTNGLLLDDKIDALVAARPDKVHLSIHFPDRPREVERVVRQVRDLESRGVRSGVNFLVRRSGLEAAREGAARVRAAGIGNDRIVYLPMRGADTPAPDQMGSVAGSRQFQSMSCLVACASSPRFCSIAWDRTVAWCSYTTARRPLRSLAYSGLVECLTGLALTFCGGTDAA